MQAVTHCAACFFAQQIRKPVRNGRSRKATGLQHENFSVKVLKQGYGQGGRFSGGSFCSEHKRAGPGSFETVTDFLKKGRNRQRRYFFTGAGKISHSWIIIFLASSLQALIFHILFLWYNDFYSFAEGVLGRSLGERGMAKTSD